MEPHTFSQSSFPRKVVTPDSDPGRESKRHLDPRLRGNDGIALAGALISQAQH
jgi:hypothetical protein